MENQRRRQEHGRGGGAGGRRGRPHDRSELPAGGPQGGAPAHPGGRDNGDPEQEKLRLCGPAGEPQVGAPAHNGEESNGRGGGCHGGRGGGGKHNDAAEAEPLVVGPAGGDESSGDGGGGPASELQGTLRPRDGKEGTAGGHGAPRGHGGSQSNDDADQESRHLGGTGGQPWQRANEQAAGLPRGGAGGREDGEGGGEGDEDGKDGNAAGGGNPSAPGMTATTRPVVLTPKKRGTNAAPIAASSTLLPPQVSFLSEALLSWTMKDLLNEDLYKNEVKKLPDTFESAGQFIDLYSPLLKEEIRAVLCSAVQNCNRPSSQYFQLLSVKQGDSSCAFYLDVDLTMTRSDNIQCHHIAKDYDICLLSSKSPLDPNLDVMSCHIGIVIGVGRDVFFQKGFTVLVSDSKQFMPDKIKFACLLTNIKHSMQTANILSISDERNNNAVRAVVELYKAVEKKYNTCPTELNWNDISPSGNKKSPTSNLSCFQQNLSDIVWAPPGTLKGYIASALKDLINLGAKVLVCLPSASNLPEILVDLKEQSVITDVLVLSNSGQEGANTYDNFFLGYQSQELYTYLTQRKSFKSMSTLLELSTYYHISCTDVNSCAHCSKSGLLTFSVQSFKQKFVVILSQLLDCLLYLKNHVARFSLSEQDAASVEELINALEKFKALLHDLSDDCIATEFGLGPPAYVTSAASTIAISLNEARMRCIELIGTIKNSVQLPEFKNRDDIDQFCIKNSRIIITILDGSSQSHSVERNEFDILLVLGAGQIRPDQMLVPFLQSVKHTILFGDHLHLRPTVQSKMCKDAGYGISVFERLKLFVWEKKMLKIQFAMHPSISYFPYSYFYKGSVKDGPNVMSSEYNKFKTRTLPSYGFMDIPATELIQGRKRYVNSAAIFMLVQKICEDLNPSQKATICVICLAKDDSNTARNLLRIEEVDDRIHLEVKCIENLQEESFDVIILSLLAEDDTELKSIKENNLNVALTSSRYCLWIVGEQNALVESGGIWGYLIYDAKRRCCIEEVNKNKLAEITKLFEINDKDQQSDSNSALSWEITHMPGQEFTWAERPYMTKKILAHVRNQRDQPDTCSFQSISGAVETLSKIRNAGLVPPQEFNWTFLLDDWKTQYASIASKPFGLEHSTDRGEKRIQTSLSLYKSNGVLASDESGSKFQRFKIKAFGTMDKRETEAVRAHLEKGGVMVGSFPISRNYFSLRPGEVYVYQPDKAITHDKSGLPVSHVAMVIGIGHRQTGPNRFTRHMVIQNSEGKLFGTDGIGRIGKNQTLRNLYWIEVGSEAAADEQGR